MPDATRCMWTVQAGIVPGHPEDKYTRRWTMSATEWESEQGSDVYSERAGAAMMYAISLQDPSTVNWVHLEWVWL